MANVRLNGINNVLNVTITLEISEKRKYLKPKRM